MNALTRNDHTAPREAADAESGRVPPHSMEAEQSILGGLLLDNDAWDTAADLVDESDFYRYEHRLIFGAIRGLVSAAKAADVITVFERLQAAGRGDESGGMVYLNALAQSVPSAANMRRYSEIVRERAVLRRLVTAGDTIVSSAFNTGGRAVSEIVNQAEGLIFRVGEDSARANQQVQGIDRLVVDFLDHLTVLHERGAQEITGVRTGLIDIDRLTTGLHPGDLVVIAARPSMGKTALALNIAESVAVGEGRAVMVFSMEMTAAQLTQRLVGAIGRVDQQHLRTGALRDDEWGRIAEAIERLGAARVFIDESPALTPGEVRARARRQARLCGGLGLVVIDYLQLMSAGAGPGEGNRTENRATELGEISRGLKALAKELKCPVIALSQLNRSVESRPDKRPMMSDLRDSGAIEQDADMIMFIYRDDYYTKEGSKEPGVAEIIIGKQRNGPTGTVKTTFLKHFAKFENLATGNF